MSGGMFYKALSSKMEYQQVGSLKKYTYVIFHLLSNNSNKFHLKPFGQLIFVKNCRLQQNAFSNVLNILTHYSCVRHTEKKLSIDLFESDTNIIFKSV